MCGRTALTLHNEQILKKCVFKKKPKKPQAENIRTLSLDSDPDVSLVPLWSDANGSWTPSPNIAPSVHTPVLRLTRTNDQPQLRLEPMMWGLVPPWHPGPWPTSHGLSTNNCRVEGVQASKLYSPCLPHRRCVVVCEGFYEWRRDGGNKQPYLVYRPPDEDGEQPLLYLAGLYSRWQDDLYSYTILTREANPVLSWLHHRMPCFLRADQVISWLEAGSVDAALRILDRGVPSEEELAWHMVDKKVGNSKNQDASLMERVSEQKKEMKREGVLSKWLNTSQSQSKMQRSETKSAIKSEDKSKNLMSNWLKRPSTSNIITSSKNTKRDN